MYHPSDPSSAALAGQVAIVTGGGRGVGLGIVQSLAQAGMSVAIVGRTEAEIEQAAEAARHSGVSALAIVADVTQRHDVARMVSRVVGELGTVDLLVNNAGRARAVGPPWECDPDEWWADVEGNLRGTFLCSHASVEVMVARGHGRVVNVVTLAAATPFPFASAYASAKAAVLRFTDSLAVAAAGHGVFAFAISPGLVRTRLLDDLANSTAGRRWIPELAARAPQDYVGADAAGGLVVRLATGVADKLSGRFIHVSDDLDDLVTHADEIVQRDLRALRLIQ
jgi:NAD(P)-dependent dehydrogenase (short-subunit alcohol dehydrogenase family)